MELTCTPTSKWYWLSSMILILTHVGLWVYTTRPKYYQAVLLGDPPLPLWSHTMQDTRSKGVRNLAAVCWTTSHWPSHLIRSSFANYNSQVVQHGPIFSWHVIFSCWLSSWKCCWKRSVFTENEFLTRTEYTSSIIRWLSITEALCR